LAFDTLSFYGWLTGVEVLKRGLKDMGGLSTHEWVSQAAWNGTWWWTGNAPYRVDALCTGCLAVYA
jgi:hypothetical protein